MSIRNILRAVNNKNADSELKKECFWLVVKIVKKGQKNYVGQALQASFDTFFYEKNSG